jgi:hypothetical protein
MSRGKVEELKEVALANAQDLAISFLVYDRRDDEDLSAKDLEELIERGELTVDEVVATFRAALEENWP